MQNSAGITALVSNLYALSFVHTSSRLLRSIGMRINTMYMQRCDNTQTRNSPRQRSWRTGDLWRPTKTPKIVDMSVRANKTKLAECPEKMTERGHERHERGESDHSRKFQVTPCWMSSLGATALDDV